MKKDTPSVNDMKLSRKKIKKLISENSDLSNFTENLIQLIKKENPSRIEYEVTEERDNLDTLTRLLVGNEVCSAIAISGSNILLATNKNNHIDDTISTEVTVKILERDIVQHRYVLEYFDKLIYSSNGSIISQSKKSSGRVVYEAITGEFEDKKIVVTSGNPNINFSQSEHKIKFPGNNDVNICLNKKNHKESVEDFSILNDLPLNVEGPFLEGIPTRINPLKRRAIKLMRILSTISNSIITRPDIRSRVKDYMDTNALWPQFLHDSLSHEMSGWKSYKDHINPSDFKDSGMAEMLNYYEYLIKDYQEFKKNRGLTTSIISIKAWCNHLGKIINQIPETPNFIKNNPTEFVEKGLNYFIDLVKVEKFVEKDAERGGVFSKTISKENLFKDESCVYVIDGIKDNQHAEMRLLEYHSQKNSKADYFGITKLCCGFCTFMMNKLNIAEYRGSHATLFGNWVLGESFKDNETLKKLFGEELYEIYEKLEKQTIRLDFQKNNESTKKSIIALKILESLASINNPADLEELGFSKDLFLPANQGNMYPSRHIFEDYSLDGKSNIQDTTLIMHLKSVTGLPFIGIRDQDYMVDAVLDIEEQDIDNKLHTLQLDIGVGLYFKYQFNGQPRKGFALQRVNSSLGLMNEISTYINDKRKNSASPSNS